MLIREKVTIVSRDTDPSSDQPIDEISTTSGEQESGRQVQLQVDDSDTPVLYSSTVRVWGSAEELNLDFAAGVRQSGQSQVAKLTIDQRVTMNPWAAKRLAIALSQAVSRYEQTYGALELDERKRRVNAGQ